MLESESKLKGDRVHVKENSIKPISTYSYIILLYYIVSQLEILISS